MAEFCLECWNKITGTQEPDGKFLFSRVPDLCEGCGEWKPVIIRLKMLYFAKEWIRERLRDVSE